MEDLSKDTEWWWIDYLENELEPVLERDLGLLLEVSEEDRDSFENFRLLKQWVRESDPVGDWPVEERCARMRKNVMNAIEAEEMETALNKPQRWADTKSLRT